MKHPIIKWLKKTLRNPVNIALHFSLFAGITVFQKADTLQFIKNNAVIDTWIMEQDSTPANDGYIVHTQQAKVANNNVYFILYDEYRNSSIDSLSTAVSLYTSQKKRLWIREYSDDRRIDFDRTRIFDDGVAITSTDRTFGEPVLEFIQENKTEVLIEKPQWQRLVDFTFSPDMRFIGLHVRNPHSRKMWDFIYFIDRQTRETWTYIFPICISCKRNRITLEVDNEGNTEVIYKEQHRIFNKSGSLIDFFMQF